MSLQREYCSMTLPWQTLMRMFCSNVYLDYGNPSGKVVMGMLDEDTTREGMKTVVPQDIGTEKVECAGGFPLDVGSRSDLRDGVTALAYIERSRRRSLKIPGRLFQDVRRAHADFGLSRGDQN